MTITLLAITLALTVVGCDQQTAQPAAGRVAVVDMAKLAEATGYNQRIGQALQQAQQQEQARLTALQQQLGLDKQPDANTSQEELARLSMAQQQMQQAVEQAQQNIQARQFSELEQFRTVVRPIAQRVASAQGYSIVMELRDNMLSVDLTSNITDLVADEMPTLSAAVPPTQLPGMPQFGPMQQGQGPIRPPMGPVTPAGQQPQQGSANPSTPSAPSVPSATEPSPAP